MTLEDEIQLLRSQVDVLAANYRVAYDTLTQIRGLILDAELPYPQDYPKSLSEITQKSIDMNHKLQQVAQIVSDYSVQVPF